MGTRLYLGNVPYASTEEEIRAFFEPRKLTEVRIINDRDTGRPKGYCFVECESTQDAEDAIKVLNGQQLGGRSVVVNYAKEREQRAGGGGGGGRGRDNRGGGRRNRSDDRHGWE